VSRLNILIPRALRCRISSVTVSLSGQQRRITTMSKSPNYEEWEQSKLIERIKELEAKVSAPSDLVVKKHSKKYTASTIILTKGPRKSPEHSIGINTRLATLQSNTPIWAGTTAASPTAVPPSPQSNSNSSKPSKRHGSSKTSIPATTRAAAEPTPA
jgi:hypothetical protein